MRAVSASVLCTPYSALRTLHSVLPSPLRSLGFGVVAYPRTLGYPSKSPNSSRVLRSSPSKPAGVCTCDVRYCWMSARKFSRTSPGVSRTYAWRYSNPPAAYSSKIVASSSYCGPCAVEHGEVLFHGQGQGVDEGVVAVLLENVPADAVSAGVERLSRSKPEVYFAALLIWASISGRLGKISSNEGGLRKNIGRMSR